MSASWVVKLPLTEPTDGAILIHVTPKGNHALDLDLLATDGDAAYKGKVRERGLKKLRAKAYEESDEEWSAILQYILVSKKNSVISDTTKRNLDVSCSVSGKDPKATLSISFHSRIEEITQKLGVIELPQSTDTDDVDLFGWAMQVVDQRDQLDNQVLTGTQKTTEAESTVTLLQKQLADLVKAKEEHENDLISKFVTLLNTKKVEVRNLQRLLTVSHTSKKKLQELEKTLDSAPKSSTATGKKRRAAAAAEDEEDSEDSDAFEKMDVDQEGNKDVRSDRSTSRATTPADTETEEEEEEEEEGEEDTNNDEPATSQHNTRSGGSSKMSAKDEAPLPPPRELPFQKKGSQLRKATEGKRTEKVSPEVADDEDDETASEDDEL